MVKDSKDKIIAKLKKELKEALSDIANYEITVKLVNEQLKRYTEKERRYEKNHCFDPKEAEEKIKEFGFEIVHKSALTLPENENVPIAMYNPANVKCSETLYMDGVSWYWKYVNCPHCLKMGYRSLGGKPIKKGKVDDNF